MPDAEAWIQAVRTSHDRFAALVEPLSADEVAGPSYAGEWSIADTASHLGSQAEIFTLFLEAGLSHGSAPGGEVFGPIWDRWNALPPAEQVAESIAANSAFVARLEALGPEEREGFSVAIFGGELDLAGVVGMRLGEHALHTWDVAVALDPDARLTPDAVGLLVDRLPPMAARAGHPVDEVGTVSVVTTEPARTFVLEVAESVTLTPDGTSPDSAESLELPAEAFIRLVAGRLDPEHTPAGVDDARVADLRTVFTGF